MKKTYLTLFSLLLFAGAFASGNCVIDTSNTAFFAPSPDSLPCVERTNPYQQVIQIYVPATINLQDFGAPIPYILTVDSMVISAVNGLPDSITYESVPANGILHGGERGCATIMGTTLDSAGHYPIELIGTFTAHGTPFPGIFDGDTTIPISTIQNYTGMQLFLDVINPGDPCRQPNGINFLNGTLNSSINIYPNPSNGMFHVTMNTGHNIRGSLAVIDFTGRTVFTQPVDVTNQQTSDIDLHHLAKGLYSVVLKTNEGIAAKNISIQ